MTTQTVGSAYPRPVEELLSGARALANRLGEVPSRNRIMREFKVGAPKAQAVRAVLLAEPEAEPATLVEAEPVASVEPVPTEPASASPAVSPLVEVVGHPAPARKVATWPVLLIALPAFVAIWSGWVGLGGLTGFGVVHPLPGIADGFSLNTAITLPIGVEVYAAYALRAWLSGVGPARARGFAKWSAIGSLLVGALGQVAYHVLVAAGITSAPWWITTLVASLPVAVLGMGAALAHLLHEEAGR